jgi:uncharacterized protein YbjT (DUF2867 family)
MRVAVFGATGTIGRALLPLLAARHEVVALSRRPHAPEPAGVEWVVADVADAAAVRAALVGVDVAFYLVHSLGTGDFAARDLRAAETIAAEAAQAGLGQIVYLSGLGDETEDLSPHLRSRLETGRRLAAGNVPVTVLRAAMVVGRGSAAFETIVAVVDRLPAMVCPRWVSTPTQPIALDDVVRYLEGVCGLDGALGRSFDIGGPEVMTYRNMIERIARIRGRRPLIVEVPILSPRLSSWWLKIVTPVDVTVARQLIDGLRNPTVVRGHAIRALIPFEPTGFDEAAAHALGGRAGGVKQAATGSQG